MSWTLSTTPAQGGTASVEVREPGFSDLWISEKRQFRVVSDGGQVYTQTLPVEDRFLDVRWPWLDPDEWSGLLAVFRASDFGAREIRIDISGGSPFPVPLNSGQSVGGQTVSGGQGLNSGQTALATEATLNVRMDTPRAEFEHRLNERAQLPMRFRLEPLSLLTGGGY